MATRDRFAPPSDDVADRLKRLLAVLDAFRSIDPAMPSSYIVAFLAVASNPGNGVQDIAESCGMLRPVASRILLEIGKKARTGGPGLGLVDSSQNNEDLRHVNYFLTTKGEQLLARVLKRLDGTK